MTDIAVLDTPVNFDFTHQFLFGTTLSQAALLNDLGSMYELGLGIDEFETFCEASLAEEFALHIAPDPDFSALLFVFLFHNYWCRRGRLAVH